MTRRKPTIQISDNNNDKDKNYAVIPKLVQYFFLKTLGKIVEQPGEILEGIFRDIFPDICEGLNGEIPAGIYAEINLWKTITCSIGSITNGVLR